jgi:predicted ATPase/tetratricopeptide (TPR) repeat protein/class 3 adenylate cyclase
MPTHALLFTDLVDSTLLVERLGDEATVRWWEEHDRCARDLMVRHGGREIDRTDGFFFLFEAASRAVGFALDYHELVRRLSMRARVGIHVGAVHLRSNRAEDVGRGAKPVEVEGLAKPLAARVMSLAQGAQTLLTSTAREALASDAAAQPFDVVRHGHYRLKGIESPVEIFEAALRGQVFAGPPPDTEKAYRVVRVGDLWQPARTIPHNLPVERDSFVGRTGELRAIFERIEAGARLLTVHGPGGAGKTRLVRRYARAWLGDWPGGIYFCDLSETRSLDAICFAVASVIQVPLGRADPVIQIGHAIAGRARCLLILDNFEQVVGHAAATVGRWLDRADNATFVVTSRERLHLPGESLLTLEPLPVAIDSVQLFSDRAAVLGAGFALTDANRDTVASIVRLLDGLPLAIELAAARIPVLSPSQLLQRLEDRFQVLAGSQSTAARQSTLRNAIDWSWTLLNPFEQAALAQCSVFEGGFDLAAAERVLDPGGTVGGAPTVLDVVDSLVAKSLLRVWHPGELDRLDLDEPFFGMYISIREYANEKLRAMGPDVECSAQVRHGAYFAAFGTDAAIESLSRDGGIRRRHLLTLELDNLVAACRRALTRSDVGTAATCFRAAWEAIELRGPVSIAVELGRQILTMTGLEGNDRIVPLATMGLVLHRAGQVNEAGQCLEAALQLSVSFVDDVWQGRVLGQLATLHRDQGRIEQAQRDFESALVLHRKSGDRRAEGASEGNLGNLYMERGLMEDARCHYEAALAIHMAIGNRRLVGSVLGNLGLLHFEQGRIAEALDCYERALSIHREVGSRSFEGAVLGNLGLLNLEQGRLEEAQRLYLESLHIHRSVGNRRDECVVLHNLGELRAKQNSLDSAQDCFCAALAIAREIGYRRLEGGALGELGALLARQGRMEEARRELEAGAAILRELDDRVALGKLLCARCTVEFEDGQPELAGAALMEAETIAEQTQTGAGSELGREIAALRSMLPAAGCSH